MEDVDEPGRLDTAGGAAGPAVAGPDRPGRAGFRVAVLVVVAGVSSVLVTVAPRHSPMALLLIAVATIGCAVLVVGESRSPRLDRRLVAAAIGAVLTVAVVAPPMASNDVWSYAMYGRIVSVHHANPYDAVPADYPTDPFLHRVSPEWRHTGSIYGPVFVGYAAAATAVTGESALSTRLLFQLGAALAVLAALALVWRRTRSTAAVLWLGLHPLFGVTVVNGGHVDAAVGLAVGVAAWLTAQRRYRAAGIAVGLGALIKLTGLLALVGIVAWAWRRGDRRGALTAAAWSGGIVALAYAPFVAGASRILGGTDHMVTPGSVWSLPAQLLVGHDAGRNLAARLLPDGTLTAIFYASLVCVALLAAAVGWRASRARRPERATGAAVASYTMAAQYALPWYGAWCLPTLAARRPSALAWIVWTEVAVLFAAFRLPDHPGHSPFETVLRGGLIYAAPCVLLVAFAVAGLARDDWKLSIRSPGAPHRGQTADGRSLARRGGVA